MSSCPISSTTWTHFTAFHVQLSHFQHHLDTFHGVSCPAVPFPAPPGHISRHFMSSCPFSSTTWTHFTAFHVQVSHFQHHLDTFHGISCPTVPFPAPPGHISQRFMSSCPISGTTWTHFTAFHVQLSHFQHHLDTFHGVSHPAQPGHRLQCGGRHTSRRYGLQHAPYMPHTELGFQV